MFGWLGDAWNGITGFFSAAWNFIKWVIQRVIGLIDFVLTLLGIMPPKKLKLRVIILIDDGKPIASREEVQAVVDLANTVFRDQMNVSLEGVNGSIVRMSSGSAPDYALDPECDLGAFGQIFSQTGAWFRARLATTPAGTFAGYGAPVTMFIVRDVQGKSGCAIGFLADYGYIDPDYLSGDEGSFLGLAHEIGHTCDLPHAGSGGTLMEPNPGPRKRKLKRWQKAVFRTSPHVTYF